MEGLKAYCEIKTVGDSELISTGRLPYITIVIMLYIATVGRVMVYNR